MDTSKEDILIGQFMGFVYEEGIGFEDTKMLLPQLVYDNEGGNYFHSLMFSESWDWLMPVVEKIEKLQGDKVGCGVSIHHGLTTIQYNSKEISSPVFRRNYKYDKIKSVYETVLEFVVWYNKQNESNEVLSQG